MHYTILTILGIKVNKMKLKHGLIILFSAILIFSLSGCNSGVISNAPTEEITDITTVSEAETTTTTTTTETTTETTTTTTTTTTSTTTSTTLAELELIKEETPELTQGTTKKEETSTTAKKYDLTITINCEEILDYKDLIQDGYSKYIPKNYYLIKDYGINLKDGDTAYTVLKRACKNNGIPVSEQSTVYGKYINAINHLDENVLGNKRGGWTYYVNGKMPNKSVDKYSLKKGDKIQFRYVKVS